MIILSLGNWKDSDGNWNHGNVNKYRFSVDIFVAVYEIIMGKIKLFKLGISSIQQGPNQAIVWVLVEFWKPYIDHTSFFRCSPRGFSATCLQQIQVVEGLSQTATSDSQCFFVWDIKWCPQITVHNTGISLLLSTSVWIFLSPSIERRETRPTA